MIDSDPVSLAKRYSNAGAFDLSVWSEHPHVNNSVDSIYAEMAKLPGFSGHAKKRKTHIRAVLLDLYNKFLTDPEMYSSYTRNNNWHSKLDARYNPNKISRILINIIDGMVALGYVEDKRGFFDRSARGRSFNSKIRATRKLIDEVLIGFRVSSVFLEKHPDTECIILRTKDPKDPKNKKKKDIPYKDSAETKYMRHELQAYNSLLRKSFIDIQHYPADGIPIDKSERNIHINFSNKFVRRIFSNGSWEDGGRFYGGWWQALPKEWRKRINIGYHQPIIEIDYSGLHIIILYALEGIDYWEVDGSDPYHLLDYERSDRMRSLLKKVLLSTINASDRLTAEKSIRSKINKNQRKFSWIDTSGDNLRKLIDNFARRHLPIKHYFSSGKGIKLQHLDSIMAEYIIREMTKDEIPVLCIHDSFIVPSAAEEMLQMKMVEALEYILVEKDLLASSVSSKFSKLGLRSEYLRGLLDRKHSGDKDAEESYKSLHGFSHPDYQYENRHIEHNKRFRGTKDYSVWS
jgi:hypothetical protein